MKWVNKVYYGLLRFENLRENRILIKKFEEKRLFFVWSVYEVVNNCEKDSGFFFVIFFLICFRDI